MAWLHESECSNAAGSCQNDFWQSLTTGKIGQAIAQHTLGWERPSGFGQKRLLLQQLKSCYQRAYKKWPSTAQSHIAGGTKLGVIFASTKGCIDDFVWRADSPEHGRDPLTPILDELLKELDLKPRKAVCVSNACASSLAALYLAENWLRMGIDEVLIFSGDAIGPFVAHGFASLGLLSPKTAQPFASDRSGFFLGDAASVLLLSNTRAPNALWLRGVGLDTEASAVTRPASSGASLARAMRRLAHLRSVPPDIVIAHGTATPINDATEDIAFQNVFRDWDPGPLITGTKWAVGHCLGASASLDIIAAMNIIKHKSVFRLASTSEKDARLHGQYYTRALPAPLPKKLHRVLVSSLGFGGMHAAAMVEAVE